MTGTLWGTAATGMIKHKLKEGKRCGAPRIGATVKACAIGKNRRRSKRKSINQRSNLNTTQCMAICVQTGRGVRRQVFNDNSNNTGHRTESISYEGFTDGGYELVVTIGIPFTLITLKMSRPYCNVIVSR